MFNRRKVDESTLNQLRSEAILAERFAADGRTEAGKHLLELLDESIDSTVSEFVTRDLSKMDSLSQVVWMSAVRSKLQTLFSFKFTYQNAEVKKREVQDELNRLLPQEE